MVDSKTDEFKVRKIYPTNTHPNRAKPWFLGKENWRERRITSDSEWSDYSPYWDFDHNLVLEFAGGQFNRFPALALESSYYDNVFPTWDQSVLRKKGFMSTKQDWKNVEITLYWRIRDVTDGSNLFRAMAFSVRGGPSHSNNGHCYGTAIYVQLSFEGVPYITKELGHDNYAEGVSSGISATGGELKDRWIGMKGVFYNKANGNPYIELWLDKNANNDWELVLSKEDSGRWFIVDKNGNIKKNDCGGISDETITWGGPGVIFKLNYLTRVDIKYASIREILPPEGWPLRYLLNARKGFIDFSMRDLAQEHGLIAPISLRELTEREAELYPFP
jgi:hypothetical protein